MGLPREVLRWLLSLKLSLPVKNPRRDFANGYLVAEVLSRHFPSDISMHSFQNAASTAEKRLNWGLISKFLATHGINLTSTTMDAVMAQDQAAVEKFLQQLYRFVSETSASSYGSDDVGTPSTGPRARDMEQHACPTPGAAAELQRNGLPQQRAGPAPTPALPLPYGMMPQQQQAALAQVQAQLRQKLATMDPAQQQEMMQRVMAQRSVYTKALMAGETPQAALAIAAQHAQLPDAVAGPPEKLAPLATARAPAWQETPQRQHEPQPRRHGSLSPISRGRSATHRAAAPHASRRVADSAPLPDTRQKAPHRDVDFAPRGLGEWREDANNVKSDTYRYWALGTLGAAETPETEARRAAVQRARQYGQQAGQLAKLKRGTSARSTKAQGGGAPAPASNCPAVAVSKAQRAKEFARSIRPPARPLRPLGKPAAAPVATTQDPRRVSKLLEQHQQASERIKAIQDVAGNWPPPTPTPPQGAQATRQQRRAPHSAVKAKQQASEPATSALVMPQTALEATSQALAAAKAPYGGDSDTHEAAATAAAPEPVVV